MGEVIIAIGIKDGKLKAKHRNINATIGEITLSISMLETILKEQVKVFEESSKEKLE